MAVTARQPKFTTMKGMSHPHGRATISTGGAANCVSVPPIETLTNKTPSVAYFSRVDVASQRTAALAAERKSSSLLVR